MSCFGGGGSKTVTESAMPEEKAAKKKMLATYLPEVGKGQPTYPGEWVSPYSPEQKATLSTIGKYTDVFSPGEMPLFGETGETIARTLRGEGGAGPITPEQTESYYKRVFEEPATRAFTKDIRPTIREAYAGPGYWSSARAEAETEGAEDLWKYLGTQRGNLEWDVMQTNRAAEEAAAQRAIGAVSPAMTYAGLPTEEALTKLGGAGGVFQMLGAEQTQRQAVINAEIEKFLAEQRITDPEDLEIIMALLGQPYGTSIGTSSGPGLGYAATQAFLGGAGQGLGYGMTVPTA